MITLQQSLKKMQSLLIIADLAIYIKSLKINRLVFIVLLVVHFEYNCYFTIENIA